MFYSPKNTAPVLGPSTAVISAKYCSNLHQVLRRYVCYHFLLTGNVFTIYDVTTRFKHYLLGCWPCHRNGNRLLQLSRRGQEVKSHHYLAVSWREISRTYFDKSVSWFQQKMYGIDGNGGVGGFTPEEAENLYCALNDLADRIRHAADNIKAPATNAPFNWTFSLSQMSRAKLA
mgnify:CR=1 FL=1